MLKLNRAYAYALISLTLLGCGGGGGSSPKDINNSSLTKTDTTITRSGKVIDGYIKGANICLDSNLNSSCDTNENKVTSLKDGSYKIDLNSKTDLNKSTLIAYGGIDLDDNKKFNLILKSMASHKNITPVTTVVAELVNKYNIKFEKANEIVAKNLDISQQDIDQDPIKFLIKTKNDKLLKANLKLEQLVESLNKTQNVNSAVLNYQKIAKAMLDSQSFEDAISKVTKDKALKNNLTQLSQFIDQSSINQNNRAKTTKNIEKVKEFVVQNSNKNKTITKTDIEEFLDNKKSNPPKDNNKTKPPKDTIKPTITLNGENPLTLEVGSKYIEAGAKVTDNIDKNVKLNITNNINTTKLGTYKVTYSATDKAGNKAEITRVIKIVDTTSPVINLLGAEAISLQVGEKFKEPGFKAVDNYDGDLTKKVKVSGKVDANKVGSYTLKYSVADSSGNKAEVSRVVNVIDPYPYIPKGSNLDYDKTFRFLEKASFGPTPSLIKEVQQKGIEGWLDEQLNVSYDKNDSLIYQLVRMGAILNDFAYKYPIEDYLDPNTEHILPPKGSDQEKYKQYFISSWFREVFWSPKQVHMRVAYALSQIVVASSSSGLFNGQHHALAAYYDVIKKNALGNYGDLLKEMSSNPAMGNYLTFYGNKKKYQNKRGEWVYPDENYAREIMQLFSIGPFLLNSDGSKILDDKGRPVPSYTQNDVNEMARVFTGLDFRKAHGKFGNTGLRYGDLIHKMVCFDEYHDSEPKTILGKTIPGGNCYDDIDSAIDVLISHQNAAPFISRKLIMRLVKSNPSPEYIQRVATVFRDTNGNLKETVRAIYLDPELWDDIKNKRIEKYKEPIIAFTQMARVLNVKPLPKWHLIIDSPSAKEVKNKTVHVEDKDIIYIPYGGFGQMPTMAKSVFNFYSDDYIPNDSYFREHNLVAPELEIQTDGQLVAYHNFMYDILNYEKNYALNRKGLNLYHPYKLKVYKNLKEYGEDLDTIYHPFRLYFDLSKYIKVVEDAFREEIRDKNLTQIDGKDLEEIFDNAHEKSYRFSEETRRKAINGMLDIIDKELLGHTMSPKFREVMVKKFAYELREYRSEDFRRFYFLVLQHLIQKTVILDDYKVE